MNLELAPTFRPQCGHRRFKLAGRPLRPRLPLPGYQDRSPLYSNLTVSALPCTPSVTTCTPLTLRLITISLTQSEEIARNSDISAPSRRHQRRPPHLDVKVPITLPRPHISWLRPKNLTMSAPSTTARRRYRRCKPSARYKGCPAVPAAAWWTDVSPSTALVFPASGPSQCRQGFTPASKLTRQGPMTR